MDIICLQQVQGIMMIYKFHGTLAMATSEQQQYLVQELTQVVMEYLNMMYQLGTQLYQQKGLNE